MTDLQSRYAKKIAALLRKAESTTPEEAEMLTSKAQELMVRYSIEQSMLNQGREGKPEKIVERTIHYSGLYAKPLREIGEAVARANKCRILVGTGRGKGPSGGDTAALYVIGFEGEVDRVVELDASLRIQVQVALQKWARENVEDWFSRSQKTYARRDFILGFSAGLATRLYRATKETTESVVQEQAEDQSVDVSVIEDSLALVVRTREEKIQDWVDQTYGKIRSSRSRGYQMGSNTGGYSAGRSAGLNANTGYGGALKDRKAVTA